MKKHTERAWWSPVVHALVHVAIGTVIFVIIAMAALVLGLLHWLGTLGVSGYVIDVLTLTEYAIVTLDAIGLLWYLESPASRPGRNCRHEPRLARGHPRGATSACDVLCAFRGCRPRGAPGFPDRPEIEPRTNCQPGPPVRRQGQLNGRKRARFGGLFCRLIVMTHNYLT